MPYLDSLCCPGPQQHLPGPRRRVQQAELCPLRTDPQTGPPQFVVERGIGRCLAEVALDQQVHAATRAARSDRAQAL